MFGENKDLALDEKGYTESKDNFCSPKVLYAVSSLESSLGESWSISFIKFPRHMRSGEDELDKADADIF